MDKAQVTKFVVKGTAGLAVSCVLGYIYKVGKKLDENIDTAIDDYFAPETNIFETPQS